MALAVVAPVEALAQAKAYLRIETADEDALIAGLVASAMELCESFTGQVLIARGFAETLGASAVWQRLGKTPVQAITLVEGVPAEGAAFVLLAEAYAVDIDANGDGWVRVMQPGSAGRVRVSFEAGMAAGWAGIPEALRQGVARLAAHLFTHRDGPDESGPPAAVTALWRPWRRMLFGAEGRHGS